MISSENSSPILGLREQEDTLEQLEASHNLLKALAVAQSQFIVDANPRILFDNLLDNLLELTQSEYGFIGEVLYTEKGQPELEAHMKVRGQPYLRTHAITNIAWNDETRAFYEEHAPKGMDFYNIKTFFGEVLVTGQPVIANNRTTDPRWGNIPEDHPPLKAFLGLPFFYKENQLLGMVGIANRPGGYDKSLITYLEPFLVTCSNVIAAHRNDKRRQHAESALLQRSIELQQVLDQLLQEVVERKQVENALRESEARERQKAIELQEAIEQLKRTQSQLVQTEKMSSLGQLVAGIAHEINNPVNFLCGNLNYVNEYTKNLLILIEKYQQYNPKPNAEIDDLLEQLDLEFIKQDLPKVMSSMKFGVDRIHDIVVSLRTFSRLDEAIIKTVNIHQGLDSTILILQHRLQQTSQRQEIQLIKVYDRLPLVRCYASQLNQVFMNLLVNAIDAVEQRLERAKQAGENFLPQIQIRTELLDGERVAIHIADNGVGIPETFKQRIFDPFFTTKPVGKGTGLGLAISHQIIEKHQGELRYISTVGQGAEFIIEIPLKIGVRG
ncbi:GAF domain-containing protein [Scytonema sp. UIC 10036]|uniref:ATP-binding protein n=1 Tax=Scytonema sp. UIC 10036 TaxID=2304196 RepID=UPI0012DA407D|nr:ATP-binding protein [Scytonema sp. UIC 10036]MUH01179.1 GAF domain-containing protein [Scytonema sp. UIC 10036]